MKVVIIFSIFPALTISAQTVVVKKRETHFEGENPSGYQVQPPGGA